MIDIINLATEALNEVTEEHWATLCKHVINLENQYIEDEHLCDS